MITGKLLKAHGFTEIAPCDIMDEEGEIEIPVHGGEHLQNKKPYSKL